MSCSMSSYCIKAHSDHIAVKCVAWRGRGAHWKYLVVSLLPRRQGVVPTDCLMIQEPLVTRGMSLKVLLRRVCASRLSPPARNLPLHQLHSDQVCKGVLHSPLRYRLYAQM